MTAPSTLTWLAAAALSMPLAAQSTFTDTAGLRPAPLDLTMRSTPTASSSLENPAVDAPSEVLVHSTPAKSGPETLPIERWLDMKTASFSARYRSVIDANGIQDYSQGAQRTLIDGKFKFDRAGKYAVAFHVSSGHFFDWAYADFAGGGHDKAEKLEILDLEPAELAAYKAQLAAEDQGTNLDSGGWTLYFRRLFLDLSPVKAVEFQYGSIDINRGAGSEITTYDDDGYMTGERLMIKDPKHLFFDEISATYGYLGNITTPDFFDRQEGLSDGNYRQYMVRKHFGKRIDASVDFTDTVNTQTPREAAFIKIPETKVIDSVRVEAYQRLKSIYVDGNFYPRGNGFAVTANKALGKKYEMQAGYADIDYNYDAYTNEGFVSFFAYSLNGDQYNEGRRWFVRPTAHLTKELSASAFFTTLITHDDAVDGYIWNRTAFNIGLVYDIADKFHHRSKAH